LGSPDDQNEVTEENQVEQSEEEPQAINLALLVDNDYLARFASIFGHALIGLVDELVNVTIVCPDPGALVELPTGPAKIVEFRPAFWPRTQRKRLDQLAETLEQGHVNLLHSFCGAQAPLAHQLAVRMDRYYAVSVTGLLQKECLWRIDPDRCRALIAISEPVHQMLVDAYASLTHRIHLVRPGCFPHARNETAAHDGPKTIVSAGVFDRRGGFDVLLRALGKLGEKQIDFLAFLFGAGPLEFALRRWVRRAKLGSRIIILPPVRNWQNVLDDADLYVQPGAMHQLHSGPYESLARGCPIVATPDTALDLVVDDQTGKTFPSGDEDVLADILADWLGNAEKLWQLSQSTSEFAREQLALHRTTEKLIDIYRTVLNHAHS